MDEPIKGRQRQATQRDHLHVGSRETLRTRHGRCGSIAEVFGTEVCVRGHDSVAAVATRLGMLTTRYRNLTTLLPKPDEP